MCIIVIKPEGVSIPIDRLKNCWDNNPDGAGFMYSENGTLKIIKGLMNFNTFINSYDSISPLTKKIVIHFRYATHGKVCEELTHPFNINKTLAMVHNGILRIDLDDPFELENKIYDIDAYIKGVEDVEVDNFIDPIDKIDGFIEKDTSDSLEFCNMLRELPKRFLYNKTMLFLLGRYMEMEGSVIVFMDNISNINIIGVNNHITKDNAWYSNYDYKKIENNENKNYENQEYNGNKGIY
jgi:hypothetical protein